MDGVKFMVGLGFLIHSIVFLWWFYLLQKAYPVRYERFVWPMVFWLSSMSAPMKITWIFRAWFRHVFHHLHHAILGCFMFILRLESRVPYRISFPWDSGGSCNWLGFLEMSFCVNLGSWMKLIGVFGILVYAVVGWVRFKSKCLYKLKKNFQIRVLR